MVAVYFLKILKDFKPQTYRQYIYIYAHSSALKDYTSLPPGGTLFSHASFRAGFTFLPLMNLIYKCITLPGKLFSCFRVAFLFLLFFGGGGVLHYFLHY